MNMMEMDVYNEDNEVIHQAEWIVTWGDFNEVLDVTVKTINGVPYKDCDQHTKDEVWAYLNDRQPWHDTYDDHYYNFKD